MHGMRYAVTAALFSKVEEVLKTMHARMTAVFLTPATGASYVSHTGIS